MRRRVLLVVLAGFVATGLSGCDRDRIARLEEGVATEADVRREFGEPAAIVPEPDGGRTFEYPRQPEGQTNYFITIGPDGRMSALRQVVKPATFAKVTPGLDRAAVRRLLGRPAKVQRYEWQREEVWDWRFADGQEAKLFSVTFGEDGKVVSTAVTLDPQRSTPK